MNGSKQLYGHIAAAMTILVWGTTFASTKILLKSFNPLEILFLRFSLGCIALYLIKPQKMLTKDTKHHFYFALAGLCGVTLYFLLENIALIHTTAANAGVIMASAPLLTALFSQLLFKEEKLSLNFFLGFLFALTGICLISFANTALNVSPLGDLLAFLAACVWALYAILCKKIGTFGYNAIHSTRISFVYGLVFMIPALYFFPVTFDITLISKPINFFNLLFLGLGASALCFVTWNMAVRILGSIKTSAYIYAVPILTIATAAIVLGEQVTPTIALGTTLTLIGLLLSESKFSLKNFALKKKKNSV